MPQTLDQLTDRVEIGDLFAKLSALLDERRFDDTHTVYHPDVAAFSPRGELHGLEALTTSLKQAVVEGELHQHVHGDVLIHLDGEQARATANQLVFFYREGEPPHREAGLRSAATVVRTPEGWRISRMTIELLWLRKH